MVRHFARYLFFVLPLVSAPACQWMNPLLMECTATTADRCQSFAGYICDVDAGQCIQSEEAGSASVEDPAEICWVEAWSHALDSQPPRELSNGAIGEQSPSLVGGRMAWNQTSDWNRTYINPDRSTTQLEAVQIDLYLTSYAGTNPGSPSAGFLATGERRDLSGMTDVLSYTVVETPPEPDQPRRYVATLFDQVSEALAEFSDPPPVDVWQRLRFELDLNNLTATLYVDGELVGVYDVPDLDHGGDQVILVASAWEYDTANVAWSNLLIEEGSYGPCPP